MKFLVTKDLAHSTLLSYLMGSVVFAILFYLGFDIVLHAYVIGLDMHSISVTLFGDAENFVEPVLIDSLLLQVHIDLFMTLFAIVILSSIYIRLYSSKGMTKWVVHLLFILGMLAPLALLVAYFVSAYFTAVWLISFVLWHILASIVAVITLKKLLFK
ncbi:hypothetical protein TSL6_12580 [Sulfurovum sp. TSL6]|uniref:hypothetical protein n=1 Tax=Sulfurovum sp. TSL6 TaxID=2826995 RepID=UPI001CC42929|nr:hypothetical protein [Sulfurovum sp. TSL6]GIU00752.1 hypothetical protein TSL6_12580 [Sulfurovum sp. TSL6]